MKRHLDHGRPSGNARAPQPRRVTGRVVRVEHVRGRNSTTPEPPMGQNRAIGAPSVTSTMAGAHSRSVRPAAMR